MSIKDLCRETLQHRPPNVPRVEALSQITLKQAAGKGKLPQDFLNKVGVERAEAEIQDQMDEDI